MTAATTPCPVCGSDEAQPHRVISDTIRIVRCRRCGLLYRRPRPADVASSYDAAYYSEDYEAHADGRGRNYLADQDRLLASFDAHIAELERRSPPGRLLDVGCALGFLLEAARRRGWRVSGMDFSAFAVDYAQRTFHVPVQRGHVNEISFAPAAFDVITAFEYIEHVEDPVRVLQHLRPWLRRDGLLVMTTPNAASWRARRHPETCVGFLEERHLSYFTPSTMRRLLTLAGFRLLELRTDIPVVSMAQLAQAGVSSSSAQQARALVNRYAPWLKRGIRRLAGYLCPGDSIKVYAIPQPAAGAPR